MKLLVFAHKPPPHHGQSYMVQQFLEEFGGDQRRGKKTTSTPEARSGPEGTSASSGSVADIELYHVDCRYSDSMGEIGHAGWRKMFRLLKYCGEAVWCRLRHGVTDFLYIPAPGMRSPLYRDWMVMALCRPFFRRRIFYWQAAGLGEWLKAEGRSWERWLSRRLLGRPDLSIVLGEYCRADAEYFASRNVVVVPNAIPDPCPEFETEVRPAREARAKRRIELAKPSGSAAAERVEIYRVLFVSLCTREKGLFDALEATVLANQELARRQLGIRVQLSVAGKFWREEEQREFELRIRQPDLAECLAGTGEPAARYCGFIGGEEKRRLFDACDCLCFPTYYPAESFGIVLIEAMAHGMQIVTTRWRSIPELLPLNYPGIVEPQSPGQLARAILGHVDRPYEPGLRSLFLGSYTRERYSEAMRRVLQSVEPGEASRSRGERGGN